MVWKGLFEALAEGDALVLVYSHTLPLARRVKEVLEERLPDGANAALVDWHRERELALRLAFYPPRILVVRDDLSYHPLDHISPMELPGALGDAVSEDGFISMGEELGPSWRGVTDAVLQELMKNLLFFYDPYNAGFGYAPKFVNSFALEAALSFWLLERDIRARKMVEETLELILSSPMNRDFSVSTFSFSPDWREPSGEHTVENQALLSRVLFMAARTLPKREYLKKGMGLLEAAFDMEVVAPREAFALAEACTIAYQVFEDKSLLDRAEALLEDNAPSTYLGDHTARARALLELFYATGKSSRLEEAAELVREIFSRYADEEGALRDTTLHLPKRFGVRENAEAVEVALKVAYLTEDDALREKATFTLGRIAKKGVDVGILGLSLFVPAALALYGPIAVKLRGRDPEMLLCAFTMLNPLRIIKHLPAERPSAQLCFADKCYPETSNPNQLRDHIVSLTISGLL